MDELIKIIQEKKLTQNEYINAIRMANNLSDRAWHDDPYEVSIDGLLIWIYTTDQHFWGNLHRVPNR